MVRVKVAIGKGVRVGNGEGERKIGISVGAKVSGEECIPVAQADKKNNPVKILRRERSCFIVQTQERAGRVGSRPLSALFIVLIHRKAIT